MENWINIKDYEEYQVSDLGNVKMTANTASRKERILNPLKTPNGYYRVGLYKNKKVKFFFIHRLVAIHFIENLENKQTVNHIDGDKSNNSKENLEWVSDSENKKHAYKTGLMIGGNENSKIRKDLPRYKLKSTNFN